jgi:2,5-diamino-6-(ribosylamino)-4(3H)-pyrimidinone 5'-phosphate reductase
MNPRPYISINMVMSLDGKSSTVSREPARFSSREDKQLLLALRARADAIMAGAGTVVSDRMTMGIPDRRLQRMRLRQRKPALPVRVIVSGRLSSLSPSLKVFKKKISPLVVFCSRRAPESKRKMLSRHAIVVVCGDSEVDLPKACAFLARYFGVRHLHVEGGPRLNGALLDADLIDELDLTVAGVVFGGRKAPTCFAGKGRSFLRDALTMRLVSIRQVGGEVFLKYIRKD